MLAVVCRVLANAGFGVLSAGRATEALAVGRGYSGPIHLIVSDVVMPGLTGPTLVERFSELHPETECLFMAGLPDTREICERIVARGLPFLPKPFLPTALVAAVEAILPKPPHSDTDRLPHASASAATV